MKPLYESIMQSRFPVHKIDESILNKSGVGKIYQIQSWLDEYGIKNYTINNKGEVDVDGDVNLMRKGLTEIPSFIQFGTIKGNFDCSYNNLMYLKGAPKKVSGIFAITTQMKVRSQWAFSEKTSGQALMKTAAVFL